MEENIIKRLSSNHHVVLWSLFILGLLLRGYGLSEQPPLDDEVAAASAATNYLQSGLFGQVMWYHPPLRNIVIFLSGKIVGGYSAWGLRGGSVILGSLSIPLLGYFTLYLFKIRLAAYLSAFFLCIDPLHISLSREAFQESTTPFLIIAATFAVCKAIKEDALPYAYFSGLLFGLASASKWHGLFPWAVSALAYLLISWRKHDSIRAVGYMSRFLSMFAALVVVPVTVYILTYIPWLLRGYSIREFIDLQLWLVLRQYLHKASLVAEQFLPHSAYQWFIMPTAWTDFVFHEGKPYLGIAMGNFLVWVLTLPSLFYAVKRFRKEKRFESGFIIAIFLASYLPLVFTSRGVWVFSAPAVIPFAFILSSWIISDLIENRKLSMKTLSVYLSLVLIFSAVMYPMSIFRTLDYPYLKVIAEMYSPHSSDVK